MPKRRIGTYRKKTINLSDEMFNKLSLTASYLGLTEGETIEFLISQFNESFSPVEKLEDINKQRNKITSDLELLNKEEVTLRKQIQEFEKWKKEKLSQKPKCLEILQTKILQKEYNDAERMAKTWSVILGEPYLSLIAEAQDLLNNSGR